jgi:hypothetical protein
MVPAGESFVKRHPIRCGFAAADGAFLHKKASQSLRPQAQIEF